jgi:hypothetical protein
MQDALCRFLNENLKNLIQTNENERRVNPRIIPGWLAFKKNTDEDLSPIIIVRPLRGESIEVDGYEDQYIIDVQLMFKSYSDPVKDEGFAAGQYDLFNLVDRTRYLLETKKYIEDRYQVIKPLFWNIPEEQYMPEWIASMDIKIQMPRIKEEDGFGI